jgi:hypothetical protein
MKEFTLDTSVTESHDGRFKVGGFALSGGNGDSYPSKVLGFNRSGKKMIVSSLNSIEKVSDREINLAKVQGTYDRKDYIIHNNGFGPEVHQRFIVSKEISVITSYKHGWNTHPVNPRYSFGNYCPSEFPRSSRNPSF